MNFQAYINELTYIVKASANLASSWKLLRETFIFHTGNALRRPGSGRPVGLDLVIGAASRRIWLRSGTGDLFIAFEVLAFDTYAIPNDIVRPDTVRTILDCGANIGLTALYFAARYPAARIICVEPDPANFAMLEANTHNEPRISCVQAALVGTPGRAVLLSQDQPVWGNHTLGRGHSTKSLEVSGVTVGEIMKSFDCDCIDIMKVDIEGAEEEIFADASFLSSVGFVTAELHGSYSLERFEADMARHGFTARPPSPMTGTYTVTAVRATTMR